jgi:hypothetical protein
MLKYYTQNIYQNMTEAIKGRHLIFIKHLCVCSTVSDSKQVLLEWRTGEIRKEDGDGVGNAEILEYIKKKILPPKEVIMRINGDRVKLPHRCITGDTPVNPPFLIGG